MNQIGSEIQIEDDDVDVDRVIHVLWRGKWLIIFMAILGGLIGIAYAFMATPIYNGNALMQIEPKSSSFAGLSDLTEGLSGLGGGGGGAETSTELELLKSRKVIVPTIERFGLEIEAEPLTLPLIGQFFYRIYGKDNGIAEPLWGDVFGFSKSYAWGGEQIVVNQFIVPEHLYEEEFDVIALADGKYRLELYGDVIFEGKIGQQHHIDDWGIDIQLGKLEARVGTYFVADKSPIYGQ